MKKTEEKIKLYSAWYCPFAQRAWLSLLVNKRDFKYIEIDPYNKTEEWMRISKGFGTAPVVIEDETTLVDSLDILKYFDNPKTGTNYSPEIEETLSFINKDLIPSFYRFLKATNDEDLKKTRAEFTIFLNKFSNEINEKGQYYLGQNFSIVDLAFIPFAYRIDLLLRHYKEYIVAKEVKNFARYQQWYEAIIKAEFFKETKTGMDNYDEELINFYKVYSEGGGQEDVTKS